MENHVFSKRRETKSEVFQHMAWCCHIQLYFDENRVPPTLQSLKLLLKGNAYNKCLFYIKNDSFLVEEA